MLKIKKFLPFLVLSCFLTSCAFTEREELEQPKEAAELLRVSVYAQKEDLPEGYFTYDGTDLQNFGCYLTSTGDKLSANDIFVSTVLEIGKPRICAPLGFDYQHNLNIRLDFDGYVEVSTDPADDDRIRLAHSVSKPDSTDFFTMAQENSFRTRSPMNLNVCPIGRYTSEDLIITRDTLTDREYFLNVTAYDLYERPKASARIRLTVVEDKYYPYEQVKSSIYGPGEERSRFLEIELVSCDYGDNAE